MAMVALDNEVYLKKMMDMFSESTYLVLNKNLIRKIINNGLHELLVR